MSGYFSNLGSLVQQVASGVSTHLNHIDDHFQNVALNIGEVIRGSSSLNDNEARRNRGGSSSTSRGCSLPTRQGGLETSRSASNSTSSSRTTTPEEGYRSFPQRHSSQDEFLGLGNPLRHFMGNGGLGAQAGGNVKRPTEQASPNRSYRSNASNQGSTTGPTSSRDMPLNCDNCNTKLGIFSRKKMCGDCKQHFCSNCISSNFSTVSSSSMVGISGVGRVGRRDPHNSCSRCRVLLKVPPVKTDLMELRVKDLQRYLTGKDVSTKDCVEKKDLVDLVMREYNDNVRIHSRIQGRRHSSGNQGIPRSASTSSAAAVGKGPIEKQQQNFPKNYVNSTHRQEFFDKYESCSSAPEGICGNTWTSATVSTADAEENLADSGNQESGMPATVDKANQPSFTQVEPIEDNEHFRDEGRTYDEVAAEGLEGISLYQDNSQAAVAPSISKADGERPSPHSDSWDRWGEYVEPSAPLSPTANPNCPNRHVPAAPMNRLEAEGTMPVHPPSSPRKFASQGLVYLSDIESLEDLEDLSVKQAKDILAMNRVNFKGVVEKEELLTIVRRLWKQEQLAKTGKETLDDEELCKICMDNPVDCVMLECGHMCTCVGCGKQMAECPICRQYVVRVVKIFKS